MVKLDAMPDEPAVAHEGRRMRVDGSSDRSAHLTAMRLLVEAGDGPTEDRPRLELLARISDTEPANYAQEHSMLASIRVAAATGDAAPHGSRDAREHTEKVGMKLQRHGAYVCNDCIDEDMASHPFSWFRRVHHLIGVDWCPKHGGALHVVACQAPFDEVPNVLRTDGRASVAIAKPGIQPNDDFVRRYVDIASGLLRRDKPATCVLLNRALSDRADSFGIGGNRSRSHQLLSDRLLDLADDGWLQRHVPHFQMKGRGMSFRPVDGILARVDSPAPGESYALALAVLFDTAIDALKLVEAATQEDAV